MSNELHPAVEALGLPPTPWTPTPTPQTSVGSIDIWAADGDEAAWISGMPMRDKTIRPAEKVQQIAALVATGPEMLSLLVEYATDSVNVDFHARLTDVIRRASNGKINL